VFPWCTISTSGSGGSLSRGAFWWNLGCTRRVTTIVPTYNGVELIEKKSRSSSKLYKQGYLRDKVEVIVVREALKYGVELQNG